MRKRQLIRRLDSRLERVDAHMERADVLTGEIREEMRLSREQHADLRQFIREQTALMQAAARGMERRADVAIERLDDMGDQLRANTQAVLTMLDRLSGNGGAAATG